MTSRQCVIGSESNQVDLGIAAIRITRTPEPLIKAGQALLESISSYGYPPVLGLDPAREAVSRELWQEEGLPEPADKSRVALTLGARAATNGVIEYILHTHPGAVILGPQLAWPEYHDQAKRYHGSYLRVRGSEASFYAPLAEDFRRSWTPESRLLVITNPGNPVGNRYDEVEIREIMAFAKERDLYVMVDEAYKDFVFDARGHQSSFRAIASDPELLAWGLSRISLVQTLAKSYQCPGARGGTLFAPPEIISFVAETMVERSQALPLVTQAMMQAAAEWDPVAKSHYLAEIRAIAQKNVQLCFEWASSSATSLVRPYCANPTPASPLFFLHVGELCKVLGYDCQELVRRLAEKGLKVVAGKMSGDEDGLRIAIGQPTSVIQEGLQILQSFIQENTQQ